MEGRRTIRNIRLDIPLRTTWAAMFVHSPPMFDWDPWWGRLFEFLAGFASDDMDWQWGAEQQHYYVFVELTDKDREEIARFLKTAPAKEAEEHRTLKRALAVTPENWTRLRLVYFSGAEEPRP